MSTSPSHSAWGCYLQSALFYLRKVCNIDGRSRSGNEDVRDEPPDEKLAPVNKNKQMRKIKENKKNKNKPNKRASERPQHL